MKKQIAAIEFGTSKIVTVIARNGSVDSLDIVGAGTVPYDGYSNGDWNTPRQMIQKVRESLSAAEVEADMRIREIYVGVPGEYIHVRACEAEVELKTGEVTDEALNEVQDAAADRLRLASSGCMILHRSPAWYAVDDEKRTMDPKGRGKKLRAMVSFVLAESSFIEDVSEMLGALNVTIQGFLSATLGEGLLLLPLEDRDRVTVLIDVGYLNTEMSVLEGDAIIYHAMLPSGGGYVAADLATQLEIPMRAAEKIKRDFVFTPDEYEVDSYAEVTDEAGSRMMFPRDRVRNIIEGSFDELIDMINLTLKNDIAQFLTPRSVVYLTGGGLALMRGGREYLAEKIGRPVKVAPAKAPKMSSPVFSSALGLADIVFDSIEEVSADVDSSVINKVKDLFRGKRGA